MKEGREEGIVSLGLRIRLTVCRGPVFDSPLAAIACSNGGERGGVEGEKREKEDIENVY